MLNFGEAINVLKEGKKVYRSGWNGKGMAREELETTGRFHQFPFKDEIIEIETNKIIYEKI